MLVSLPVSGEESTAFLVRGPVKETGLSYIYPNAFEIYKGFYRYGKQDIIVIFTPGDFIIPENWTGKTCGDYTGYVFADSSGEPGGVIFCYREKPENKNPAGGYLSGFRKITTALLYPSTFGDSNIFSGTGIPLPSVTSCRSGV